jgi:hypothetical protein
LATAAGLICKTVAALRIVNAAGHSAGGVAADKV